MALSKPLRRVLDRERAPAAGVCLLAVMIAATQFFMARFHQLSPWKGGGFGMFSTGDAPDKRLLRVQLDFGNYSCWTRIPKKFRERELRIKAMPSIGELDELSRVLLGSAWQQIPVDHHGANCYGAPNNARVLLAFDDGSQLAGVGVRVPRKVRLRLSRYSYVGSTASLRVEDLLLLSTGD